MSDKSGIVNREQDSAIGSLGYMNRDALVVGINRYPFLKNSSTDEAQHLETAENDAEKIAQLLETQGSFQVTRLPEKKIDGKVDPKGLVNTTELENAINNLFIPEGERIPDIALLYFAGHGFRKKPRGSMLQGYLGASDASDRKELWGVSLKLVQDILRKSPVKQLVVWLDCCHSGELFNFREDDLLVTDSSKVCFFVTACRDFEKAYGDLQVKQGKLTTCLLKGLDSARGQDTSNKLKAFLEKEQKTLTLRQRFVIHCDPTDIILIEKSPKNEDEKIESMIRERLQSSTTDFSIKNGVEKAMEIFLNQLEQLELDKERIPDIESNMKILLSKYVIASSVVDNVKKSLEIVKNFIPQLKAKTYEDYRIIEEIIKLIIPQALLLEKVLEQVCDPQVKIPDGENFEWLESIVDSLMFKELLQIWTVAYEKQIVEGKGDLAKTVIDKAFCESVEDWTKSLLSLECITEIRGREFDKIEKCIEHHIDNLEKGGMWRNEQRPTIEPTNDGENVFRVTVSNCAYKEGCEWGLGVPEFRENGQYRCQRLGCFVGAVKKYMSEDSLPEDMRETLDYLMTTVMDEKQGCQGLIFINHRFMRAMLLRKYPTRFPDSSK